ncbi:TadE/TadG family type IV pilus assembly protein [Arthrobacter sp. ZGTC131]|uniref:TadE/TadG family type IV pilus assembly protein n=1 Tax=Arthrobacter sp. ZGTC131 TaxID=2058898 RepID=UPI000CE51E30|nr:TadE/TadG family type IV pilus assembly protein [Arthrobacter sp. ZGTC131]
MRRLKHTQTDRERGAAGVLVAVMILVLIGAGALAVDVGQIYAERAQLQNAADLGALAVVEACYETGCSQDDFQDEAETIAESLANANSNDGQSNVAEVDLSVENQVTVRTTTESGSNSFLTNMFASALDAPPVAVGAYATATFLYPPTGVSVLPLVFATCEFKDDGEPHKILTHGGSAGGSGPDEDSGKGKGKDKGDGDGDGDESAPKKPADCNSKNPSGQVVPGGFAWLNPNRDADCEVRATVGLWSDGSEGLAIPTECKDLFDPDATPSLKDRTVALPVYAYTCEGMAKCTGSHTEYMIEKWAGFKIEYWSFPGHSYDPSGVFGGGETGLYGTFVGYAADPSQFTGGSPTPNGNVVVIDLID